MFKKTTLLTCLFLMGLSFNVFAQDNSYLYNDPHNYINFDALPNTLKKQFLNGARVLPKSDNTIDYLHKDLNRGMIMLNGGSSNKMMIDMYKYK